MVKHHVPLFIGHPQLPKGSVHNPVPLSALPGVASNLAAYALLGLVALGVRTTTI